MIYLHVPFCRSFCTYCDFYSEIACRDRDAQQFAAYADAVCAEAQRRRGEIEATRSLNTLYIGGGTPSVLPPSVFKRIVDSIGPPAALRADGNYFSDKFAEKPISAPPSTTPTHSRPAFTEFTIEVNPEDIVEKGPDYVHALLSLGVNRVSMGVQSLDDGILRWMNRRHDAARARQAFCILRDAGVDNLSVDLIFGLSQLSEAIFKETLDEIVRWRPATSITKSPTGPCRAARPSTTAPIGPACLMSDSAPAPIRSTAPYAPGTPVPCPRRRRQLPLKTVATLGSVRGRGPLTKSVGGVRCNRTFSAAVRRCAGAEKH